MSQGSSTTTRPVMDIKNTILASLDDLSSTRSSLSRRCRALDTLERLLAEICISRDQSLLDEFLDLQRGFECNISSRVLTSLVICLPALQQLLSSTSQQDPKAASEAASLTQLTQQALSVLQGVALLHPDSKAFLGRKSSVHLLLDLLSISRHALSQSPTPSANVSSTTEAAAGLAPSGSPTLASAIVDTLLCVLVDSPAALRVFEEASGVEAVVKTLKRVGIAREVRMKCLEFLYFYLLPEDGSTPAPASALRSTSSPMRPAPVDASASKASPSRSVPTSPVHRQFPVVQTRGTPIDQLPTSPSAYLPNPAAEERSRRSPDAKEPPMTPPRQKPSVAVKATLTTPSRKSVTLQMLQKEIDYVPVSPKKAQVAGLGVGTPGKARNSTSKASQGLGGRPGGSEVGGTKLVFPSFTPATPARKRTQLLKPAEIKEKEDMPSRKEGVPPTPSKRLPNGKGERISKSHSNSSILSETTNIIDPSRSSSPSSPTKSHFLVGGANWPSDYPYGQQQKPRMRSTEEKKELLGNWLGNVDALVDGVQKAGVWGLA